MQLQLLQSDLIIPHSAVDNSPYQQYTCKITEQ